MVRFCTKCGSSIDPATGLCPNCDRAKLNTSPIEAAFLRHDEDMPPAAETTLLTPDQMPSAAETTLLTPDQLRSAAETTVLPHTFCTACGSALDPVTSKCMNPYCKNGGGIKPTKPSKKKNKTASKPVKLIDMNKPAGATRGIMLVLALCLLLTSMLAVTILDARNALTEDNIEALLDNVSASDAIAQLGGSESKEFNDFCDWAEERFDVQITDAKLDKFVEKSTVKSFVAKLAGEFCEDFFAGDRAELVLERNDLDRVIERNSKYIESVFDCYMDWDDEYDLSHGICADSEYVVLRSTTIERESPVLYYALTIGLSYITMGVFIALSLLIIFFMVKKNTKQAMLYVGVDFTVLGGVGALVALLAGLIPSLWSTVCGGSFVGIVVGNFFAVNVWSSVVLLVIGIALIVLCKLLKKKPAPTVQYNF